MKNAVSFEKIFIISPALMNFCEDFEAVNLIHSVCGK